MATKEVKPLNEGEELVPVYLFKDSSKYKDDVFVAVNGKGIQVQRGKQVMIPKMYADVLQQSMEQDATTAELIQQHEDEFNRMNL